MILELSMIPNKQHSCGLCLGLVDMGNNPARHVDLGNLQFKVEV
jgi:hypothetical protein